MSIYISKYANGAAVDAALDKAESSVQPGDIGTAAAQNVEAFEPADATILKSADIGTSVCSQTDPRLSDTRDPKAHKSSHATGQPDALSPADIGALATTSIDDTSTANNKLWSAQKISGEMGNIAAALDAINGESI